MKNLILAVLLLTSAFLIVTEGRGQAATTKQAVFPKVQLSDTANTLEIPKPIVTDTTETKYDRLILQKVPFIAQAPLGHWADPRQEDGCEEASSLMAVSWAQGKNLPAGAAAEKTITAIADWEQKNFQNYHDTSARDTADRILGGYFDFHNFEVKNDITLEQLKSELYAGNIVIAPMDGVALHNPNFRQPGPPHHMLVIIGYDPKTDQFITNDPGTHNGASYRYSSSIIEAALRDYPTGDHDQVTEIHKNIIVIKSN